MPSPSFISPHTGLRLGLCCQFAEQTNKFRATTAAARATWNRKPLFHISSPLEGLLEARPATLLA